MNAFNDFLRRAVIAGIFLAVFWKPIFNCGQALMTALPPSTAPASPLEPDYVRRHVDSIVE